MAETINPPTNAPAVPAGPEPGAAAPAASTKPKAGSGWSKKLVELMTTTTFLILGMGFILLSFIVKLHPSWIPPLLQPILVQVFPHLPYFIIGIGFFFLGLARSMAAQEYTSEAKKNKKYPHAWKIPLVSAQAAFFYIGCFLYALPAGLGWIKPITNPMGLVFLLVLFCVYVLWYLVTHFMNRMPSIVGLRMAVVALVLSALSCTLWAGLQMVFLSLLVGLLALITLLISAVIRVKGVEEIGARSKIILLIICVFLLGHVGWHALPFDNPRADLIGLNLAAGGLNGTISSLTYFQDGNKPDGTKIALSQKTAEGWILQVLNPDNENMPLFKVPAGDEEFRSLFVQKGNFLLIDKVKNGQRGIWKVNANNGTSVPLNVHGIQPIEDGVPWSEKNGQLLYVTQNDGKYDLKVLTVATGKSKTLLASNNPIHTPSWVNVENPNSTPSWSDHDGEVAYADGVNGLFWVLDLGTNQKELLKSDLERMQGEKFSPEGTVLKVIPSPDGFRYLYLTKKGGKNIISLVRNDGTRRDQLYETKCSIGSIAWHPDSQQIVFEEKHEGLWQSMDLGFLGSFTNIRLLDGNLGTVVNLIPAQISNRAPALSTDGAKIAFVSGDGLWYPSQNQGIWVAILR
ncbi:MAG TPA: hypothetical protein VK859_08310 [bacterium]|nr:hypothetical protein [bacterium]